MAASSEHRRSRRRSKSRLVAWIPVALGSSLFGWAYYVYVYVFCGSLLKDDVQRLAFGGVFHVLLLLCLWSFLQMTVTMTAPIPPSFSLSDADLRLLGQCANDKARRQFLELLAENRGVLTRNADGGVRYCEGCRLLKPDRTHHCSQCKRCIPKMDHHCVWFNNCVSFSTYKFFLLTLFYIVALCVFGVGSATQHVAAAWSNHTSSDLTLNATFLYVFGVVLGLFLACFLYTHFSMVATNVTTLEGLRPAVFKDPRDSFDVGWRDNFAEVFGRRKALWLLPVFTALGDGAHFPTRLQPDRNALKGVSIVVPRPIVLMPTSPLVVKDLPGPTVVASFSKIPPSGEATVVSSFGRPSAESACRALSLTLVPDGGAPLPALAASIGTYGERVASLIHSSSKRSPQDVPASLTSVEVQ
ncbi:palmitoyltransferase ZDHHC15A-like [Haemaphysalis longicornis]